jgi:Zn-finger nucleic acid-binding protein
MNCPVCTVELKISDRQGVEIDYCPKCRGVWLDRGELDKILERANAMDVRRGGDDRGRDRDDRYDDDDDDSGIFGGGGRRGSASRGGEGRGEGRESFWSNLFDFG